MARGALLGQAVLARDYSAVGELPRASVSAASIVVDLRGDERQVERRRPLPSVQSGARASGNVHSLPSSSRTR